MLSSRARLLLVPISCESFGLPANSAIVGSNAAPKSLVTLAQPYKSSVTEPCIGYIYSLRLRPLLDAFAMFQWFSLFSHLSPDRRITIVAQRLGMITMGCPKRCPSWATSPRQNTG